MPILVAALGNPGIKYAFTRHNIAWQLLEYLSFFGDLTWQHRFKAECAAHSLAGQKILLLKPQAYMNLSGGSVAEAARFHKLTVEQILVIHDDLELDFGVLSLKKNGGLAGHNGLRSVAAYLDSRDFYRFRLGISRPDHPDITSYVLGEFTDEQQAILPVYLQEAARILEQCLIAGFDEALEQYKKKKLIQV